MRTLIALAFTVTLLTVLWAEEPSNQPTYSTGTMYLETPSAEMPPLSQMQKDFERLEQFEQYLRDKEDPRRASNFI